MRDGLDFHVPDRVWAAVVPKRFRNLVACLRCFDRFAWKRRIDYRRNLRFLVFVGDQACLKFRVVRASPGLRFRAIAAFFLGQTLVTKLASCGLAGFLVVVGSWPVGAIRAEVPSVTASFLATPFSRHGSSMIREHGRDERILPFSPINLWKTYFCT